MKNQILGLLKCALSNEEHFLIKPVTLTCGHSVCQDCILEENTNEIKCKICFLVSEQQDFSKFPVSKLDQQALSLYMCDIFQVLEKETTDRLNKLKGNKLFILMIFSYFDTI